MLRSILLIIVILILNFSYKEVFAGYIPGNYIFMTGSNNDVRFDVKAALNAYKLANPSIDVVGAPALDTTTPIPSFTGAFYGSGIGWIMFSTGIYKVELNCSESLSVLSTNCQFTGSGWNENIGEIGFGGVEYNPLTGLLEGSAYSYMGDIDLSDIALPLRPTELNETNIIANHDATLSISGSWMYEGGNDGWRMDYEIDGDSPTIIMQLSSIFLKALA